MPKKFYVKAVAVVLVIGILVVAVPVLKSAERKAASRPSFLQILKQPVLLVSALFPAFSIVAIDNGGSKSVKTGAAPISRVRPTGDSPVLRPGTGD